MEFKQRYSFLHEMYELIRISYYTLYEFLDDLIQNKLQLVEYELYVCSEGLSYASKGDATLNLATYKGVLLSKIYEHYGDHLCRLFTYAPITLKSTAGCAGNKDIKDTKKTKMIDKFAQTTVDTKLRKCISNGLMKAKSNYIPGIDDIVDSYWALQTMIKKENI